MKDFLSATEIPLILSLSKDAGCSRSDLANRCSG